MEGQESDLHLPELEEKTANWDDQPEERLNWEPGKLLQAAQANLGQFGLRHKRLRDVCGHARPPRGRQSAVSDNCNHLLPRVTEERCTRVQST